MAYHLHRTASIHTHRTTSVTYQIIYSSESTFPMKTEDLEELLERARARNSAQGISGALIYADGMFLQILEGEHDPVQALMAAILKDVRHENVLILREGTIPSAKFSRWDMAYIAATAAEAANWAGVGAATAKSDDGARDVADNVHRTAQFAQDILALLKQQAVETPREEAAGPAPA